MAKKVGRNSLISVRIRSHESLTSLSAVLMGVDDDNSVGMTLCNAQRELFLAQRSLDLDQGWCLDLIVLV